MEISRRAEVLMGTKPDKERSAAMLQVLGEDGGMSFLRLLEESTTN